MSGKSSLLRHRLRPGGLLDAHTPPSRASHHERTNHRTMHPSTPAQFPEIQFSPKGGGPFWAKNGLKIAIFGHIFLGLPPTTMSIAAETAQIDRTKLAASIGDTFAPNRP